MVSSVSRIPYVACLDNVTKEYTVGDSIYIKRFFLGGNNLHGSPYKHLTILY